MVWEEERNGRGVGGVGVGLGIEEETGRARMPSYESRVAVEMCSGSARSAPVGGQVPSKVGGEPGVCVFLETG